MDVRYQANNKGLSVVGLLIGASGMVVVGLTISQLIQYQNDLSFYMEDRLANVSLQNEIMLNLNTQNSCENSLNISQFEQIANTSQSKKISITNTAGDILFQNNSEYGKILITNISARPLTPIAPQGTGIVEFTINSERTRGLRRELNSIRLKRKVTLGTTSSVVKCASVSSKKDEVDFELQPILGKVKNISKGCDYAGVDTFRDMDRLQDIWGYYCHTLSYPQPRTAYNLYGIEKGTGKKYSARKLVSDMKEISVYKIERLTGAVGEEDLDPQARGPYKDFKQCFYDGVYPLGARYKYEVDFQVGTKADGSPEYEKHTKEGQCIAGGWW